MKKLTYERVEKILSKYWEEDGNKFDIPAGVGFLLYALVDAINEAIEEDKPLHHCVHCNTFHDSDKECP